MTNRPKGLDGVIEVFGNIPLLASDGIISPEEEALFLTTIDLPFRIKLSWLDRYASKLRCNKVLAPVFLLIFKEINDKNLEHLIINFGGCYSYRSKRVNGDLSTHAWGISIDINPDVNKLGTKGCMPMVLVEIFERHGFIWGGRWKGRKCDPMHFQFCEGY